MLYVPQLASMRHMSSLVKLGYWPICQRGYFPTVFLSYCFYRKIYTFITPEINMVALFGVFKVQMAFL